ncbi:hypothetical protein ABPG72_016533 [Tetrahymena utriculariae]
MEEESLDVESFYQRYVEEREEGIDEESCSSGEEESEQIIPEKKKRGRRKVFFANIQAFKGSQFLKKSTSVIVTIGSQEEPSPIYDYFDEELKNCFLSCVKSKANIKQIIKDHGKTYRSTLLPDVNLPMVYMSSLEKKDEESNVYYEELKGNQAFIDQIIGLFTQQFTADYKEEEFREFLKKKDGRIDKYNQLMNPERGCKQVQILHKKILKQRKYNMYTDKQIEDTRQQIIEQNFKNYDKIAQSTGIKISMIKKIASKIRTAQPMRVERKKLDRIDQLTEENKSQIIKECISSEYNSLSLTKKTERFNELFNVSLRYHTYRSFLISQGFRHKSLIYSPVSANSKNNQFQILKSSIHMIDNFIDSDDVLAIDESGLNQKCFSTYFWTPKGVNHKIYRDVKLKNHSLIMLISMKYGVISYQIKEDSYNSGYFLNFLKKSFQNYKEKYNQNSSRISIIMDNCSIHKMEGVINYLLKSEYKFIYTAPYSSPMNPIEESTMIREIQKESKFSGVKLIPLELPTYQGRQLAVVNERGLIYSVITIHKVDYDFDPEDDEEDFDIISCPQIICNQITIGSSLIRQQNIMYH